MRTKPQILEIQEKFSFCLLAQMLEWLIKSVVAIYPVSVDCVGWTNPFVGRSSLYQSLFAEEGCTHTAFLNIIQVYCMTSVQTKT